MSLKDQQKVLVEWIRPFEREYPGNMTFLKATKDGFGPGYGYIEAQALHGFLRTTKPRRMIEIGSGVSTSCMLNAAGFNKEETGISCDITCIEPNPFAALRSVDLEQRASKGDSPGARAASFEGRFAASSG